MIRNYDYWHTIYSFNPINYEDTKFCETLEEEFSAEEEFSNCINSDLHSISPADLKEIRELLNEMMDESITKQYQHSNGT